MKPWALFPCLLPFLSPAIGAGKGLAPRSHDWLPIGAVKPRGWLLSQAQIQAETLGGHLQVFWLNDSRWLGGSKCPSVLCESVPYWLNGLIPLAVQLDNAQLQDVVHTWVRGVLDHQQQDGWMGPGFANATDPTSTPWSRYRMLTALGMYSNMPGADPRTVPAMYKLVFALHSKLKNMSTDALAHLFPWAHARWQELVYNVQWLLDHYPDADAPALVDVMETARSKGLNWEGWYNSRTCENVTDNRCFPCREFGSNDCDFASSGYFCSHGVNVGQSFTAFGVDYRMNASRDTRTGAQNALERLDFCHGQPGGVWSAHEVLGGIEPNCGTETCAVVETMNTVAELFSYFGDVAYLDRVEEAAFNRLPASYLNGSMWALTYFHQTNTMGACTSYGLPFECCVANGNQGWPRFISHLYAKRQDGDLAVVMYAPSSLNVALGTGTPANQVQITLDTRYPFSSVLHFTIYATAPFNLWLRIPGWAVEATVRLQDQPAEHAMPGGFHKVQLPAGQSSVELVLPMSVRVKREVAGGVSVHAGPLLFALDLQTLETKSAECYFPPEGCRVTSFTPQVNWRTALVLDQGDEETGGLKIEWPTDGQASSCIGPFASCSALPKIRASGAILSDNVWPLVNCTSMEQGCTQCIGPVPNVTSLSCITPVVTRTQPVSLIPFGATDIRIAVMPVMWTSNGALQLYV